MSDMVGKNVLTELPREANEKPSHRRPRDERLFSILGFRTTRARMALAFVLVALLTATFVSIGALWIAQRSGTDQILRQLESVAVVKQGIIDTWLDSLHSTLVSVLPPGAFLDETRQLMGRDVTQETDDESLDELRQHLTWMMTQTEVFDEIFLMDAEGRSVLSTDLLEEGKIHINQTYFHEGLNRSYVTAPFYSPSQQRLSIVATRPLVDEDGSRYGIIAGRASMDKLSEIMSERTGLGDTGQTYLVGANHGLLTSAKGRIVTDDDIIYVRNDGVNDALDTRKSVGDLVQDFRGVPVAGRYQWYPRLQVLLVAEQDQSEAFRPIYLMLGLILALSLLIIVVTSVISLFVSRRITTPLTMLAGAATQIEGENFNPDELDLDRVMEREDEFGQLRAFLRAWRKQYSHVNSG